MNGRMKKIVLVSSILIFGSVPFLFNSCTGIGKSMSMNAAGTAATPAPVQLSSNVVAGNGMNVAGTGALSVPTGDAVVARIQNGLQGNVSSTTGNFAKALALLKPNLPQVTDPTKATGYDQVQLLAYAACSDLTTGKTPLMQSKYNVSPTATIATNQSALVMAGVQMLDQYTAGLASGGPTSAQVNTAFTSLVTQLTGDSTNTSTIAFVSVCIAANTAGSTLLGF